LQRVAVCSASNELATEACQHAGTAYTLDLPASRIPHDGCHIHRGSIVAAGEESPRRSPVSGLLRSFRKFFGGP
jgi:penicillin-binding protein 1A